MRIALLPTRVALLPTRVAVPIAWPAQPGVSPGAANGPECAVDLAAS